MLITHRLDLDAPGGVDYSQASVFFIGNATVILRCCGFTILTDPNFIHKYDKVSIGYGLHATRLTEPALDIKELPPIDLVVLSHFHGDHFDQIAERELRRDLPIFTPPSAARELEKRGFNRVFALDTWGVATVSKGEASLEITATPGKHGPGPLAAVLPDVMGSVLHFKGRSEETRLRTYISGDTW